MPDLTRRHTTRRRRHRYIIGRDQPPCAICGQPINYEAHHLDPDSFHIDHRIPLARGGLDELNNLQATHRRCNREKSDKLPGEERGQQSDNGACTPWARGLPADQLPPGVTFVTGRRW